MKYKVKNSEGQEFRVDLLSLKEAEKDGYHPVMTDGQQEYGVKIGNLPMAFDNGFQPVSEGEESQSTLERYARGAIETLPMVGGMVGGVMGTALGPVGTAGGVVLGSGLGKTLENVIETAIGDDKTKESLYREPLEEMAWATAGEGAGQAIGKAYQKGREWVDPMFSQFKRSPKPNVEEIVGATKRIGTTPTQGMLTENKLRQGMESSIAQSPFSSGREIEGQYKHISDKLRGRAEKVLTPKGGMTTPIEAGGAAKGQFETQIRSELQPSIDVYSEIAEKAPNIPIEDVKKLSESFLGKKYAKYRTGDVKTVVKNIAEDLGEVTTLEELRDLKTIVGAELSGAQGAKRLTLGEIHSDLVSLEQKALKKAHATPKAKKPIPAENIIDLDSSYGAIEKRFSDNPETIKALKNAQLEDGATYIANAKGEKLPWVPNYAAKPTGTIGTKGLAEPFPNMVGTKKGNIDPLQWADHKYKATKKLIQKHADEGIALEINTSSDLIGRDDYLEILPDDTTVNMYLTTSNDSLNRHLFPGSPSNSRQMKAVKRLREAGVNVKTIKPTYDDIVNYFGKANITKKLGRGWEDAVRKAIGPELRIVGADVAEKVVKKASPVSKASKEILEKLETANLDYGKVTNRLKALGKTFKLGKVRNYEDFIRKMKDLPDEIVADKLFNAKDYGNMILFKKHYPKAFETIKANKLTQLYEQSITKGEISFPKLLGKIKKMNKQTKRLLFGKDGVKALDDIDLIYNNFPDTIGPSGTPKGQEYRDFNPLSPTAYGNEAKRRVQKWLLDNPEKASKLALGAKPSEKLAGAKRILKYQTAKTALKKEYAPDKKITGPKKMAKNGLNKILLMTRKKSFESLANSNDKEVEKLLIQASAAKVGSKMFNNIIEKLNKKVGK